MFVTFKGQTLILRKIVEEKAFPAKLKHRYCVFKLEDAFYHNHENNRGYYENPCLSHLRDKL